MKSIHKILLASALMITAFVGAWYGVGVSERDGDAEPKNASSNTVVATPAQSRTARAMLAAEKAAESRRRAFLSSRAAKNERKLSRTAYRDQSDGEAVSTVKKQHKKVLKTPAWSPPKLQPGDRPVGFMSTTTQRVDIKGQKADAISDSPGAPIATERGGELVSFDTSLRSVGNGWLPTTTDLATRFPNDLTSGITAPLGGDFGSLIVRPSRASGEGMVVGDGMKVMYPNALNDTDVIAEALPRGGEISWALRSNRSPEELPLEINIERKDESIELVSGGAVVLVDQKPVVSIKPPVAFDAQGQDVPVHYVIAGGGISVRVDHRAGDFAYPIVVDPYYVLNGVPAFRDTSPYDGAMPVSCSSAMYVDTNNSVRLNTWLSPIASGCRHHTQWSNATRGSWWAKWVYNAPNASTIFRAEWGDVHMQSNGGNRSNAGVGIANGSLSAWEGATWAQVNPIHQTAATCANASCTLAGSVDNRAQIMHGINVPSGATLPAGAAPQLTHVGVAAYFSDYSNPVLSGVPPVNEQWQNTNPQLSVTDSGVGLSTGRPGVHAGLPALRILRDNAGYLDGGPSSDCGGGTLSPCPTTYTPTVGLNEGDHQWSFTAADIVGRTTSAARHLRIDRTPPEIGISGRLGAIALDAASIPFSQPRTAVNSTPFTIQAVDGRRFEADGTTPAPAKDRRSGVKSVTARVFGSDALGGINLANEITGVIDNAGTKQNSAEQCDTNSYPSTAVDSCKITYTGTLNAATLPRGIYYFRVTAKDWLNQESTKDFKVGVGSASLQTIIEGQATSRYVPIQIKRERGTAATASLQFRTKLDKDWCDIPATAIRSANGPLTAAPAQIAFDSNGVTETVVLDMDALRQVSAPFCSNESWLPRVEDGMVYVRGLVAGTEAQSIRASEDVGIRYERGGLGTDNDSADLGVGAVDLVSGNLSFSATDVSVDAYKSDLTVTRTFNSRYAAKKSPFGPGWEIGLSSESMGASYEKVSDFSDVDIPELERYPAVVVESTDGTTMTFELEETTGKYRAEDGLETLKLERIPDAYDPTRSAGFKLTDLDSGTVATFSTRSADTPAGDFKLTDVYESSTGDKVTYAFGQSSTIGNYPTFAFAPSAGLSCRDTNEGAQQSYDTLPRGCQALKFNYDVNGERRLTSISMKTYDPATSAMVETTVAQYAYNAERLLIAAWDPRESTLTPTPVHLKDEYTWVGTYLSTVKPAGQEQYVLGYEALPEDSTGGRFAWMYRSALSAGTAAWSVRYFVPTSGANAPFDFSASETSKWGQERPPFMAAAVFPPDQQPNGNPATNYDRASMSYLDPLGREVNSLEPGGRISTKEYDKWGSVTRTLTPENRARAMALPTPAERLAASEKWDTQNTYGDVPGSGDGRRHLVESVGPERSVRLDDGSEANARTHTRYTYDEGISPDSDTGEPFDLVTTERVSALVGTTDHDVRTTETSYGSTQAEWRLRIPREVTTDPGSGNLNIKRKVDVNADGMEIARYQPRSQNSSEPSTTKTIYWKASTNPDDAECGGKPEWLGLPCKVLPGAQPTTAGLAKLPVKKITYNALRQPQTTTETVVDAGGATKTRTTTATYDAAGRVLTESITGDVGEPIRSTRHVYDPTSGREVQTQSLNSNGTAYKTISRTFDTLGRQTEYTDSEGHTSTMGYDLLSRVVSTNDGKASRTNIYDPITGDLTGVNDSAIGSFTATYDADGRILTTMLPGGMLKTFRYDEAGFQNYLSYAKTSGCTESCRVFENWAKESAHGQIRELWQDILPQGQSLKETAYEYRYDKAGRLKEVGDWRNDSGTWKCGVREYTLDAGSNRTAKKSIAEQDFYCDFGASGTTTSSTYDNADRITDAGYVYDAFGRITTTPQSAAGGTGNFDATYYVNDLVHSVSQNGTTQTLELDPKLRMSTKSKVTGGNTTTETYAYSDDSDSPAWIQTGSTWQRYVDGIDGAAGVQDNSGSAKYYFVNLRGDVVASGFPDPVESAEVDEFGVPKTDLPSDRRYGFHGSKQREALTSQGMIAMGVRLYAPRTGRFLQVDPVLGGTANPYEYPSDPVNAADLDGRSMSLKKFSREVRKSLNKIQRNAVRAARKQIAKLHHSLTFLGKLAVKNGNGIVLCGTIIFGKSQAASHEYKSGYGGTFSIWTKNPDGSQTRSFMNVGAESKAALRSFARAFKSCGGLPFQNAINALFESFQ